MIDAVAIQIGPLAIRWYALCIVSGLILAVYLAMKEAPRKKIDSDKIIDFILIAFPLSIVGARLYYVVFSWEQYKGNLSEIIAIWNGGIAVYGGLLTGLLVMIYFCRHHFYHLLDFLDIAVPGVMIAQSIGRWGNFFNQEAYGAVVKSLDYLPSIIREQMYIDGSYRQPTFLFESLWNLIGFVFILMTRHRGIFKQGDITAIYLTWYGIGRFWIEGLRTDSLMLGSFRVSQWISLVLVLVGLGILFYNRLNKKVPAY